MDIYSQLQRDEGTDQDPAPLFQPYRDSRGYETLGFGHLIDARLGGGIDAETAEFILHRDVAAKTAALAKALPWLRNNGPRYWALVNMAFQLGADGLLEFRQMLAAYQAGDWATAKAEALDSAWAKQTPERAARVAKQIETGEWQ